jgi:hypothetical protein
MFAAIRQQKSSAIGVPFGTYAEPRTIPCVVQFKGAAITEMPRVYLAAPAEIGQRLKETAKGRGDTILWEQHTWAPRAHGAGTLEQIPSVWKLSPERLEQLLGSYQGPATREPQGDLANVCRLVAAIP